VPLTTLLAPLSTDVADFLENRYFGVSPFRAKAVGRIKVRLSPPCAGPKLPTRAQGLDAALARGPIALLLEARLARLGAKYRPVARIELVSRVDVDQEQLRFDPFRSGRKLEPTGFVHALRIPVYAASRASRPREAPRG
jgi:hypothetical protein